MCEVFCIIQWFLYVCYAIFMVKLFNQVFAGAWIVKGLTVKDDRLHFFHLGRVMWAPGQALHFLLPLFAGQAWVWAVLQCFSKKPSVKYTVKCKWTFQKITRPCHQHMTLNPTCCYFKAFSLHILKQAVSWIMFRK